MGDKKDNMDKGTQAMFNSVQDIFALLPDQTCPVKNEMVIYDNAMTSQFIEMKPMNTSCAKKSEESNEVVKKLKNALSLPDANSEELIDAVQRMFSELKDKNDQIHELETGMDRLRKENEALKQQNNAFTKAKRMHSSIPKQRPDQATK